MARHVSHLLAHFLAQVSQLLSRLGLCPSYSCLCAHAQIKIVSRLFSPARFLARLLPGQNAANTGMDTAPYLRMRTKATVAGTQSEPGQQLGQYLSQEVSQ